MSKESVGYLEIDFPVAQVAGVVSLLRTTLSTFLTNLGTISMIILTVFLPLEIAKNYLYYIEGVQDSWGLSLWIDGGLFGVAFGSLTTPALIYALMTVFRRGNAPPVGESLHWGWRQFGRVLVNRCLAGMAIGAGALFLVIPGIIFTVWFAFVDAIVSVEGDKQPHVLRRSRELTKGHRGMLFFSGAIAFLIGFPMITLVVLFVFRFARIVGVPMGLMDHWLLRGIIGSLIEVIYQILPITFLLAYLHCAAARRDVSSLTDY